MDELRIGRPRRRSIPLLLIALVVGAMAISPGVDAAKKALTKGKANKRYLHQTIVVVEHGTTSGNTEKTVMCPNGYQAIAGGWSSSTPGNVRDNGDGPVVSGGSHPGATTNGTYPYATGWYVDVFDIAGPADDFAVAVICAKRAH